MMEGKEKELPVPDVVHDEDNDLDEEDEYDEDGISYRAQICNVISTYLVNPLELSTFATGGEIDAYSTGFPVVVVGDVGRISYPLSKQQAAALLQIATQAPFGKGTETIVDVEVRRAWQIEADLVTINKKWMDISLPKIVAGCCVKLGVDAERMKVSAHLYKLLLYEEGGHFKKHKDTEKEPGMFGSLLIQLPAEHEGGALVVEHDGVTKRFDFAQDSADKAYYSSFYSDCDHVLEPVTRGFRLVLAFNLVRTADNASNAQVSASVTASHRKGFEDSLVAAVKEWCADPNGVQKFVYPLSHKYTQTSVSFGGMKGSDQKVLNLLRNAVDPTTGEKLFSVYLALVTKHVTGTADEYYGRGYGFGKASMSTDADTDTQYETDNWVGPNGAVDLGSLSVDFTTEIVTMEEEEENEDEVDDICAEIFGEEPDQEEDEGYCGNYAGTLEHWYRSAVLVFWPARKDFSIELASNPAQAVSVLTALERTSPDFAEKLQVLLDFLVSNSRVTFSVQSLLPLVQGIQQVRTVLGMCTRMGLSKDDCKAVVNEVGRHGLQASAEEFLRLLSSQPLQTVISLLELVRVHCPTAEEQQAADASVPSISWHALIKVFATKILQSPCTESDAHWASVCQFAVANCDNDVLVNIAKHLGAKLKLSSLNYHINRMTPETASNPACGVFVRQLQFCAVSACVTQQNQPPSDVVAVVDWVVKGGHADLMATLKTKLRAFCGVPELFRRLFATPSVVEELKKDTPISADLESLVQVRIDNIAPHVTPPAFSWCMPAVQTACRDPVVSNFLAGPKEYLEVTGFNGISAARQFADKCRCAYMSVGAHGTGPRATVSLRKNRNYYSNLTKTCADNATELHSLRKLLRVRERPSSSVAPAGGNQPAQKKQKVGDADLSSAESKYAEEEVIVIDD